MSNQDEIVNDEQTTAVNEDEQEKVDNQSSESADEVDEALEAHKKSVYQGMIDKEVQEILFGKKSLEEIKGKQMRSDIESKLEEIKGRAFAKKSEQTIDEDALIEKTKASIKFDEFLSKVDDESKVDAKADYKVFTSSGLTVDQAIAKLHKLYGVKTAEESIYEGQRIHKVSMPKATDLDDRKLSSKEKALKDVISRRVKEIK